MLVWVSPGWAEYHAATDEDFEWLVTAIEPRYREILEKMAKAAANPDACETVELGRGPFGMDYIVEITKVDPDDMDFMQMIGAAPRMGVAMDIFAVREVEGEKVYELVGHAYEDGREKAALLGVERI